MAIVSRTFCLALACLLGLGCTPELADSVTPGDGWPDLATPPVGRKDGRADAALIIALSEAVSGGRPGAYEVASGWWRYLVETRGLRRRNVQLLLDEAATTDAITLAIERLEERSGTGSMLWLVFIGSADSPSFGGDGALLTADGGRVPFAGVREALIAGMHESAFMLIDGCATLPEPGRTAGLPAVAEIDQELEFRVWQQLSTRTYYLAASEDDPTGMLAIAAEVHGRVEHDLRRESSTLRNAFMLTAGVGPACGDTLDGRPWPALAYAGLGALQGWADIDEDGYVAATELAQYAQSVLAGLDDAHANSPTRVQAGGVDLILADAHERWDRRVTRLAPERLSQTTTALAQAATQIVLRVEDMVPVAPGEFAMGCTVPRRASKRSDAELACERDEHPRREIELGGYAIDRTEVRWRDYRACIASGVCPPLLLHRCWVWTGEKFERGAELPAELFADDHPVMCVNWAEANNYCRALGKRLPSEAEWERAARGTDARTFPWGAEPPTCKHAVMHGCTDFTRSVGSLPAGASPVGALDMAGNVSEWVEDWWAEDGYARQDTLDPTGPSEGEVRAVRGGSFYDGPSTLRTSYRYGIEPLARLSTVGFRCAR